MRFCKFDRDSEICILLLCFDGKCNVLCESGFNKMICKKVVGFFNAQKMKHLEPKYLKFKFVISSSLSEHQKCARDLGIFDFLIFRLLTKHFSKTKVKS